VFLGKLGPDDTFAGVAALSFDGTIAAGTSVDSAGRAWMFRWTAAGGMERVTALPEGAAGTWPAAMSADGRVVVGRMDAAGDQAFVWDAAHGVRALATVLAADHGLALAGWRLARATAVSTDGRVIAGTGTNPQGGTEAWVVRLPE
jgi:uncharacterized membrane protein